jgi:hypothetical protein
MYKKQVKILFLLITIVFCYGCAGLVAPQNELTNAHIAGIEQARTAEEVLSAMNNINTCPPGMRRDGVDIDSQNKNVILTTNKGTNYRYKAGSEQSHKCVVIEE